MCLKVPKRGYVGVGRVTGPAQPASTFKVKGPAGDVPFLDVAKRAGYHRQFIDDAARAEYVVPIQWLQTVPLDQAVHETGFFGNQNTVCKPTATRWRTTVEKLKKAFPGFDR